MTATAPLLYIAGAFGMGALAIAIELVWLARRPPQRHRADPEPRP